MMSQLQGVCSTADALVEPVHILDVTADNSSASLKTIPYEIRTNKDLQSLLSAQSLSALTTRIYSISQEYSWSRLQISEESMKEVMAKHHILPDLVSFLSCFRERMNSSEEAFCAPFVRRRSEDKYEYAYTFKYPELKLSKMQTTASEPWALRQTAIYHQYRFQSNQSFWILLNPIPGSIAQGRVHTFLKQLDFPSLSCKFRHTAMDDAIISTYLDNWRPYLEYYEVQLLPLTGMIYGTRLDQKVSVDFNTMTNVHYIKSRFLLVKAILESFYSNMEQLEGVAADFEGFGGQCAQCTKAPRTQKSQWIAYAKEKCATFKRSEEHLLDRCNSTIEILSKRLEFNDKHEVQKQSGYLLQLTKSAVDDSVAVRVITFITLVYLSCTVVGVSKTIMEMPFFYLAPDTGVFEMSKYFWVYVVISVPLTVVTLLYWRFTVLSERRKRLSWSEEAMNCHV